MCRMRCPETSTWTFDTSYIYLWFPLTIFPSIALFLCSHWGHIAITISLNEHHLYCRQRSRLQYPLKNRCISLLHTCCHLAVLVLTTGNALYSGETHASWLINRTFRMWVIKLHILYVRQSPFLVANIFSASQENFHVLLTLMVHKVWHESPPLVPVLRLINSVYPLQHF